MSIIYTNDEHGWMQHAATLPSLWREAGCLPDSCLILSGGDMWTGPAVSSWVEGESMVEVMNALGYDAAAVGNHEFDFGRSRLQQNAARSTFPYLAANLIDEKMADFPADSGFDRWVMLERAGVRVALIGLATQKTPSTTLPSNVAGWVFTDYVDALTDLLPEVQSAEPDLIIVISHLCGREIGRILAADLPIDIIGGGHCNERRTVRWRAPWRQQPTLRLYGGGELRSFAWAQLQIDTERNQIVSIKSGTLRNRGGLPNPTIVDLVERWQARVDADLGHEIVTLPSALRRRSRPMQRLILASWLEATAADVAIINRGAMRASLPAGSVTANDIVNVLPFNNKLVVMEMSGAQLRQQFGWRPTIGVLGVGRWQWQSAETYRVVLPDFLYEGGDRFDQLQQIDPNAQHLGLDWRGPLVNHRGNVPGRPAGNVPTTP